MENANSEFIIFKTEDEKISVDVRMESETVWLTQDQMAILFDKRRSTVAEHILNVFKEGELEEKSTCRKIRQVRMEGNRTVEREIDHYNLDVIISVGYRVKSLRGTQFRQWATKRLNEYIRKGFTMDDTLFFGIFPMLFWPKPDFAPTISSIKSKRRKRHRCDLAIFTFFEHP